MFLARLGRRLMWASAGSTFCSSSKMSRSLIFPEKIGAHEETVLLTFHKFLVADDVHILAVQHSGDLVYEALFGRHNR